MKKIIKFFKSFYFWPTVMFLLITIVLLIGLFFGIKWFVVSTAYADSYQYGYCAIDSENFWKQINFIKEFTDVRL